MSILIGAQELSKAYAERTLFKNISFSIESGERVGLIGPNGAGKSSLLSILAGRNEPDSGKLSVQRGLRVAFLEQLPLFTPDSTVENAVMEGAFDPYEWEEIAYGQELIARLDLTPYAEAKVSSLSGGWRKRVAIARELIKKPDLFLLDEPTNHLDVESILWLEEFLSHAPFATVTITHDRVFLQKVSTRIMDLNRRYAEGLLSVRGNYVSYLEARNNLLSGQESSELKLRNTLRRETEWLRRGAKARTTKQQARINRAETLGDTVEDLIQRNVVQSTRFDFQSAERNPKKLIHAEKVSVSYGGRVVVPSFDIIISPKTRLGLLGANGCGKSTLIRALLKQEKLKTGTVTHAENIKISYFEQNRENLDPELSVRETICPKGDYVEFGGSHTHIRSYLDRFLFVGPQADMLVRKLSGGEQTRLLLAKLMLQEANVLVLDEPTNDLDMTTLDLLQDVLQEFKGAVILVTHDRYFLDQVANQILGFSRDKNDNTVITSFSNLEQWENWRENEKLEAKTEKPSSGKNTATAATVAPKKKLSFKEQRELDSMESTIATAEARLKVLTEESIQPEMSRNASKLLEIITQMDSIEKEIERLYARWTELS